MTTYSPILYGTKNNTGAGCGREGKGASKRSVCVYVGGGGGGGAVDEEQKGESLLFWYKFEAAWFFTCLASLYVWLLASSFGVYLKHPNYDHLVRSKDLSLNFISWKLDVKSDGEPS